MSRHVDFVISSREHWPCGLSQKWPDQRRIRNRERHRREGEAIPRNPLCSPPCGAPPPECSPRCRSVGGGERRHSPAPHVRPGDHSIKKDREHNKTLVITSSSSLAGVSRIVMYYWMFLGPCRCSTPHPSSQRTVCIWMFSLQPRPNRATNCRWV